MTTVLCTSNGLICGYIYHWHSLLPVDKGIIACTSYVMWNLPIMHQNFMSTSYIQYIISCMPKIWRLRIYAAYDSLLMLCNKHRYNHNPMLKLLITLCIIAIKHYIGHYSLNQLITNTSCFVLDDLLLFSNSRSWRSPLHLVTCLVDHWISNGKREPLHQWVAVAIKQCGWME